MGQSKKMIRMVPKQATHVSLVDRGANQTPFKVIKSDKSGDGKMAGINLNSLVRRVTKSADTSAVVAVVAPNAVASALAAHLASQNLQVTEVQKAAEGETGDIHIIQKSVFEDPEADLRVITIAPEIAVVCKGFRPYSDDFEETATFSEIIKARTLPLYDFGEVLAQMLRQSLYKSEDKMSAVSNAVAILEDAKQYISELFNGLPDTVFKMAKDSEAVVAKAAEEDTTAQPQQATEGGENGQAVEVEKSSDAGTDEGTDPSDVGGGDVPVPQGEGETGGSKEEVVPETAPAADPEPAAEPAAEPVEKAAPELDVNALADTITKAVAASLEERFNKIESDVQSIAKSAEDNANTLHETLGSTVSTSVTKSAPAHEDGPEEGVSEIGMIDTAYRRPQV